MSFPFYKPLMPPKPRRRDRRGAMRTERLHEVLLWPDRTPRSSRDPDAKRAAFARLQARYAPAERTSLVPLSLLGFVSIVLVLAALEFGQSRHLVAYASASERYEQLVAEATANCAEGACSFGWFDEPPTPEMKRLMSSLRARRVSHDPWTGTTVVRGAHKASFWLIHVSPEPTPEQALAQAHARWQERERWSRAAARGWSQRASQDSLGNGWVAIRDS